MVVSSQRKTHLASVVTMVMALLLPILLTVQAFAIARGYSTNDDNLSAGMVASLSQSGESEVERADQTNAKRIVGVVTTPDSSSVTVASGDSQVLIESEGDVDAYVSDIGGEVKKGDLLSLSSFKGILMKAVGNSSVLAVALEDSASVTDEDITNYTYQEDGTTKTTKIFKIRINLNKQGAANASSDPTALSKIGETLTGKQVSDIRVLAALIIFILVMIAEGGIIYGAVTSAITALGRNPMARRIIRREMTRIILVAIGVLALGLGAVYGILWY